MMSKVTNKHDMQNKFSRKIITNFKALKICNPFFAVVFLFPGAEMWRWFCKIAGGREEEEEG
jgi:hypothetical protein